jgi:hypothetical protein
MLIKISGLGFKEYFKDAFNAFDFTIVTISCVDVAFTLSNVKTLAGSEAIQALRAFRLMRVFKLAKSWK